MSEQDEQQRQREGVHDRPRFGVVRPAWRDRLRERGAFGFGSLWHRFVSALDAEGERGGVMLWVPVALGIGCLIYFVLPREPLVPAFPLATALLALAAWVSRGRAMLPALLMWLAIVALGATLAQWRTISVSTPTLSRSVIVDLAARIERIELRANGSARYTMRPLERTWSDVRGVDVRPTLVRATARKALPDAGLGDVLEGKARLAPAPGPSYPGGYDFAFHGWFDGIGASGFFLGQPALSQQTEAVPVTARLRAAIARHIRAALPGEGGAIAVALIVGDRSGISDETSEALRRSGLAHILAISGLHMSLVVVTVLFAVRFLLASIPGVALRYPVKKWAAATALLAATGYLMISGGSVSAQRAYVMVAIMLLAILADRRALSMRNVALAAIIVLVLRPEAVLMPGFQMSFSAVAALIATFEILAKWRERRAAEGVERRRPGRLKGLALNMAGLAGTSLVAGIATGLFAAYHFHRIAPLGLIANVLAMPFVSTLVMPAALVSMVAMPFGLEAWPLQAMDLGQRAVVFAAESVASRGPGGETGVVPVLSVLLGSVALLIGTLCRTGLRWSAAVPLGLAVIALPTGFAPDLLVSENGRQVALVSRGEALQTLRPKAEGFTTRVWESAYGRESGGTPASDRGPIGRAFRCDAAGCVARHEGYTIVVVKDGRRLFEDCRMADILVIPFDFSEGCPTNEQGDTPVIFDRTRLSERGSAALRFADGSVRHAISDNGRPWTAHRSR